MATAAPTPVVGLVSRGGGGAIRRSGSRTPPVSPYGSRIGGAASGSSGGSFVVANSTPLRRSWLTELGTSASVTAGLLSSASPPLPAPPPPAAPPSLQAPSSPPLSLASASISTFEEENPTVRYLRLKHLIEEQYHIQVQHRRPPSVFPEETYSEPETRLLENVQGLEPLRVHLKEQLLAPLAPSTKYLFKGNPPQRITYVRSDPGSGVDTLLSITCAAGGINVIHINMSAEIFIGKKHPDEFFGSILQYATELQPCVIFFDRCDPWFQLVAWEYRGWRFSLAYQNRKPLYTGTAHVWVLISCSHMMQETEGLMVWLGTTRDLQLSPLTPEQRGRVFVQILADALKPMAAEYRRTVTEYDLRKQAQRRRQQQQYRTRPEEEADEEEDDDAAAYNNNNQNDEDEEESMQQLGLQRGNGQQTLSAAAAEKIAFFERFCQEAVEAYEGLCLEWARHHESYTPGMIHAYCSHAISMARQRLLRNPDIRTMDSPGIAVPVIPDFEYTDRRIEATLPGVIKWRST